MFWLLIGGSVVVWFAVASAGFRRLLAILAGVVVVGIVLILAWSQNNQNARTKENQAAKLRIPHTNVEFVDLRMETNSSFVKLTGRVRNNDPRFTLTYVELRLRVQECPAPDRCDTVGDTTDSFFVDVPPQQAREIDDYVSFRGIGSPRMKRSWLYEVVSISGKSPDR
jgi:hypothetical protein